MGRHNHDHIGVIEGFAKLDVRRAERTGIPEAIFSEGKTIDQVLRTLQHMADSSGTALATRVSDEYSKRIRKTLGRKYALEWNPAGHTLVVRQKGTTTVPTGGCIGILAAGTSDVPTAEEARVTAEVMGCRVIAHYDVGIAGIHRLLEPLQDVLSGKVAAIVVVAGMEGALPSVVRGLVGVPVIGVPTSTGYGYGGHGQAALMTMLQSCAPGLTVVNIDNGFGAGATAALIANQVASAHSESM
ncbi:MAG TPA: nickel pincer cofactor biosynthesis protein LarB [Bacteroidota bacterium]|nr:nickel pincer cofactor biosynthesis protein LarB [Bacteroidota bacterium]